MEGERAYRLTSSRDSQEVLATSVDACGNDSSNTTSPAWTEANAEQELRGLEISSTLVDEIHEDDGIQLEEVLASVDDDKPRQCDKYDTTGEAAAIEVACKETSTDNTQEVLEPALTVEARRPLSPWVDGLGWYSQIKRLEDRAETNKRYEEEVSAVEEKFVASAVMVQASDLEVRIHAEADGTEIRGTWYTLQGKLPSAQAWIGLFPHRSRKSYSDFVYIAGIAGEFSFRGVTPGIYQVRLFGDKFVPSHIIIHFFMFENTLTKVLIVETEPILVGPNVSLFIAQVKEQDEAVLFYYGFENVPSSSRDWIAIYDKTQKRNKSYLAFRRYGNPHGVVQLALPRAAGNFEARIFAVGAKYNEQATVEFTVVDNDLLTAAQVDGGVRVKWSMNRVASSMSDWIGLYKAGARSTNYLMYAYTHGAPSGELVFRVSSRFPKGSYQVRIFATRVGRYMSHKGCNFTFD